MWPWGHVALAYLTFRVVARGSEERFGFWNLAVLVIGAGLPDLVDKTLGWYLGVAPSGRSVAHSAFVAFALTVVVFRVSTARGSRLTGTAFATGYFTHLGGDVVDAIASPPLSDALFWLYPVWSPPAAEHTSVGYHFGALVRNLATFVTTGQATGETVVYLLEFAFVAVALWTWLGDGKPGVNGLQDGVFTRRSR